MINETKTCKKTATHGQKRTKTNAKKRGAKIIAEFAGYGSTDDAYHVTQPSEGGVGAIKAMSNALKDSNLNTSDIDYINAHGTSTPLNDLGICMLEFNYNSVKLALHLIYCWS